MCHVPGIELGIGAVVMSRTDKSLCPHESYKQIDINIGSNECC